MLKKRTSSAPSNDDETNINSESLFQTEDNTKRAKCDLLSDTALQDLPIELLQCILIKAVTLEVKGLKLAKRAWGEKAELVINRLRTVCSQWNSILSTKFFRNELQKTLNGSAQETIRLEFLHEFPTHDHVYAITVLKDEIFMLYNLSLRDDDCVINVYNRNNLEEVTDVIPVPGEWPLSMRACDVSNCMYIGLLNEDFYYDSVSRISRNAEHKFYISPWIRDERMSIRVISVSAAGNLIILSEQKDRGPKVASVYSTNGFLQHEIMLPQEIDTEGDNTNVIQKSNGNLVFGYAYDETHEYNKVKLLEVDLSGSIVRQYESPLSDSSLVNFADVYGRIMIANSFYGIDLFDSEFNLLGRYRLKQDDGRRFFLYDSQYNSERNEIVRSHMDKNTSTFGVTFFRFTEE